MKKIIYISAAYFTFSCLWLPLHAQTRWINGFGERIAGENLDYHSCHPEANSALLIRCLNNKDYIEWKTDSVASDYMNELITFAWIAGYSVATSTAAHKFFLFVNDKLLFEFNTDPKHEKKDWQLASEDNSQLYFKFIKVDHVDDFFGYMILTFPFKYLEDSGRARIKIKGDATNSKDWYMTMQYPLMPKTRISPEKVISKDSSGNLHQRIKVSIDHFDIPKKAEIKSEGNNIESEVKLGMNDFYLEISPPKAATEINIKIAIDGILRSYTAKVNPAREITFYLIPHAHVDVGYTDLQTNVEKKHWENFDKAIDYSKRSAEYGSEAIFKWNVEVLWAVKSYLENFPEKKEEFYNAVRKGWIGLDATFANVMTALCRPEELYRLVEYSNDLEKEIGIKIESAMISDIPGYTWGIVQAFADNGIKYFSVGTNEFDRIGNTLKIWGDKPFYWKSPSGKEKILIWLAGKGYSWFHRYRLTRDDFSPAAKYLDELDMINYPYDMVHVRYNIGGDNGFPDSTLSEFVKHWNETHCTPKFKISTNSEMFKDFEEKYGKDIPVFSGDFTPYWEDGAGSTAKETALNRNSAELLNQLEILYTIFDKDNFPKKEFDEAWKYVLLFSEHTWGAWNSISDPEIKFVTGQWEIKKSYAEKADSLAQRLLKNLAGADRINSDNFYVSNSSSWERSEAVKIPKSVLNGRNSLVDNAGNPVPLQKLNDDEFVFTAKNIPAMGFKEYNIVNNVKKDKQNSKVTGNTISNGKYSLSFKQNSAINFLGRNGSSFNFVDTESGFGLNEFIHTGKNAENTAYVKNSEIKNYLEGPVFKSITAESEAEGCTKLLQEVMLFNDLDKIEIRNIIGKKKEYEKENLRFVFPLRIKNPESRIDLAWSVIQPEKDQLPGSNKNYFTAQRWIDISNDQHGMTIATIDAPFIELGGMNAEAWMFSPDKEWSSSASSSSLYYSWAMNNSWHTNFKASQEGNVIFKYVLKPHEQFDYLSAYKFGIEAVHPLQIIYDESKIKKYSQLIELDPGSSLVITLMKPSVDLKSLIVRIFNPTDKAGSSFIKWTGESEAIFFKSNGDEDEREQIGNKITLDPFEVTTLKIKYQ